MPSALWDDVPLKISFRSTAAVLDAVDAVFSRPEAQEGLVAAGGWPLHEPSRIGQAGLVELWPPAQPLQAADPLPWAPPLDRRPGDSPRGRLARLIAARIATDDSRRRAAGIARPARPAGDIMVLVRRRNSFVEELVRALKQRNVPVAGVDRMVLTEQLAVMDLMALGQFLLLPEDDLTLATVLKSPLIGLAEDDLYALAQPRAGGLWSAERARDESPAFAHAYAALSRIAGAGGFRAALRALCRAPRAARRAAGACSRGSGRRRPIRSTNSSISRSPTSASMCRRCRASCTGSASAASRSSAISTGRPATRSAS